MITRLTLIALLLASTAHAQEVRPVPDYLSYATAAVNPSIAIWKAVHSEHKVCSLAQLGISEVVGNGATLTMKHFIKSPRPVTGLAPDGMPSGHSMNGVLGSISSGWRIGASFSIGTGILRSTKGANRHTAPQIAMGLVIGAGAELTGHLLHCQ